MRAKLVTVSAEQAFLPNIITTLQAGSAAGICFGNAALSCRNLYKENPMKINHDFIVSFDPSFAHAKEIAEILYSSEDKNSQKIKLQIAIMESLHKKYLFILKSTDRDESDMQSVAFEINHFELEDIREKLHAAINEIAKEYCEIANAKIEKYGPCVHSISERWYMQNIFTSSCQEIAPYVVIEVKAE